MSGTNALNCKTYIRLRKYLAICTLLYLYDGQAHTCNPVKYIIAEINVTTLVQNANWVQQNSPTEFSLNYGIGWESLLLRKMYVILNQLFPCSNRLGDSESKYGEMIKYLQPMCKSNIFRIIPQVCVIHMYILTRMWSKKLHRMAVIS